MLIPSIYESKYNKKVLLRERKRHTARRVGSAHYAALSRGAVPRPGLDGGGGYPIPGQGGTLVRS